MANFNVGLKLRMHRSRLYDNAPMPQQPRATRT
jgi:hypothetical protein